MSESVEIGGGATYAVVRTDACNPDGYEVVLSGMSGNASVMAEILPGGEPMITIRLDDMRGGRALRVTMNAESMEVVFGLVAKVSQKLAADLRGGDRPDTAP